MPKSRHFLSIHQASRLLKKGGVVAFPTETVYGLGADVYNEKAVCRIFEIKKRPSFDPLIVHVASIRQAESLCRRVPPKARILMKKFWPGPLSLVLEKEPSVPDVVTSGLGTVAIRMPKHPKALALIQALGRPIAAPSANLFGRTSPTTASDVLEDLGNAIGGVVDGGRCRVGVESTVIKVEKGGVFLLRPGGISVEELEKVLGQKIRKAASSDSRQSPGLLKSHYAPKSPLILFDSLDKITRRILKKKNNFKNLRLAALLYKKDVKMEIPSKKAYSKRAFLSRQGNLYEAASNLFQAMRKLDKINPDYILAEKTPSRGIGLAVADRLEKASAQNKSLKKFIKLFN